MDIIQLSKDVLIRLSEMDYERKSISSKHRLIFPNKFPSEAKSKDINEDKLLKYTRISEQELRFLFVEQFLKDTSPDLFYSVETPTISKYKFGKKFEDIQINTAGRSASIDMSVFNKDDKNNYRRILNIEFKHQNAPTFSIGKDILKLIKEPQNGAFIILLENTGSTSLCNVSKTGVLDKLHKSFTKFRENNNWGDDNTKEIHLIILSLEKTSKKIAPVLIHRKMFKSDLENLDFCFTMNTNGYGNIGAVEGNGWEVIKL